MERRIGKMSKRIARQDRLIARACQLSEQVRRVLLCIQEVFLNMFQACFGQSVWGEGSEECPFVFPSDRDEE